MKTYQVSLNGRQYSMLEKMLCSDRAGQLTRNQRINGYELFSDMLKISGWEIRQSLLNVSYYVLLSTTLWRKSLPV